MLPEWASTEDPNRPGRKAQWFADARALFKQPGWGQFNGLLYYNYRSSNPNCAWLLSSSQSAVDADRAMAADAYCSRTSL